MSLAFCLWKKQEIKEVKETEYTLVFWVDGVRKGINLIVFLLLSTQTAF